VLENTDGRLSLRIGKRRVDVPVEDVRRLDLEVRDSLTDGAVIGAATLGLLCALVCGQGLDSSGDLSQAVMTNAVVGAAIGAFLDSRMNARQVVYERSRSASQSRRASAVPLLTMRF
jgi:outer membrane lipoprotein SlyB